MMEEDKTSEFSMKDFYKVLRYIPKARVDRQEPCEFEEYIVEGERAVLKTIHGDFNGTDNVQLYLNCHGVDVDVSKVLLGFSPLVNGNVNLLEVNSSDEVIDVNTDTIINFTLDTNVRAADKSRILTGIQSITVDFGKTATNVEILNVVIRSLDYTYTLADLEVACENGQAYVLRRLNNMQNEKQEIKEIPDLLKQYVYMAAGAYAWLTRWEYEAKPMKEPKSESNNYADRLFGQVNDAIEKYLSNIENNRDEEYLNLDHVASAEITWGIR